MNINENKKIKVMKYIIFSDRDNVKVMKVDSKEKALEQIKIIESDEKENGDFIHGSYSIREIIK